MYVNALIAVPKSESLAVRKVLFIVRSVPFQNLFFMFNFIKKFLWKQIKVTKKKGWGDGTNTPPGVILQKLRDK